jgi:class 3 adenylate cyclase
MKDEKTFAMRLSMVYELKKTTGVDRRSAEFKKPDPSPSPMVVTNAGLDGSGHSHAMGHLEYVLVPKPFVEMAVALVLEQGDVWDEGVSSLLSDPPIPAENLARALLPDSVGHRKTMRRRLTAIFSADVVGFCRLMNENEVATVSRLTSYRQLMTAHIETYRGRVVDSAGDNLLAEFPSVVDAVQCAVRVQRGFQELNKALPENHRMEFRIGINLGEVIDQGDRIYGDGVNIAARLQGIADPGGLCISETAYDQIENKLPLEYEYLGKREVKNIPKPVTAYRVVLERKRLRNSKEDRGIPESPRRKLLGVLNSVFCLFTGSKLSAAHKP